MWPLASSHSQPPTTLAFRCPCPVRIPRRCESSGGNLKLGFKPLFHSTYISSPEKIGPFVGGQPPKLELASTVTSPTPASYASTRPEAEQYNIYPLPARWPYTPAYASGARACKQPGRDEPLLAFLGPGEAAGLADRPAMMNRVRLIASSPGLVAQGALAGSD